MKDQYLKTVHRVIKLNLEVSSKAYVDLNRKPKKKKDSKKGFFSLRNNTCFGKNIENVAKQRYQACNTQSKNELFKVKTKLSYTNFFSRQIISITNERNLDTHE